MTAINELRPETTLYAEDDELVRGLMCKNLQRLGFKLLPAIDGQDAITRFTTYQREIKLLLLDIIMPKVDGIEAYREIRKMQPGIKAMFCSGCPDEINLVRDSPDNEIAIITKPVNLNLLTDKIREMLRGNVVARHL